MRLLTLLLLLSSFVVRAGEPTGKDAELSKRLQGSWVTDPAEKSSSTTKATYRADGTGEDVVRIGKGPDAAIVRLTTRWSVKDGKLCLESIASSHPQIIPIGLKLKDIIVSISDDRLVLEAFQGYGASKGTRSVQVRPTKAKQGEQGAPPTGP